MAITLNGTSGITSSGTITSDGLTIDTNTLYVDDTNNRVGIGNIVPATALDVTGTITSDGLTVDGDVLITTNTDTNPFVISRQGSTNESLQINLDDGVVKFKSEQDEAGRYGGFTFIGRNSGTDANRLKIDHTSGDISFYEDTGTSQKFFWDSSAQSTTITAIDNVTTTYPLGIQNAAGSLTTGYGAYGIAMPAGSAYTMDINGDLIIDAGGNVGIGTTSPTQALEVAGNILINTSGNPYLAVKTSGAGNNPFIRIQADTNYWDLQSLFSNADDELDFRYNGSSKMIIDNSGNVGIGTPSPSYKLDVNGKVYGDSFTSDPIASWQITGSYAGTTQYVFTTKNDINALGYGNGMYRFVAFLDTYNAGASHYSVYMPYRPFYFYNVNSNATSLVEMGNSYGRPFMGHAPNTFTTPSLYVRHRSSTDSTYPGNHTFEWDMKTAFSNLSTSGGYQFIIYLYKIS